MELIVLVASFVLLALASALGWAADSRDGADWAPDAPTASAVDRWHSTMTPMPYP